MAADPADLTCKQSFHADVNMKVAVDGSADARLTKDSIASESSPTEPVIHHAAVFIACAVLYAAIAAVAWRFVGASALAEGHVRPDAVPYVDAVTAD